MNLGVIFVKPHLSNISSYLFGLAFLFKAFYSKLSNCIESSNTPASIKFLVQDLVLDLLLKLF